MAFEKYMAGFWVETKGFERSEAGMGLFKDGAIRFLILLNGCDAVCLFGIDPRVDRDPLC